jgi:hypothetical protein
VSVLILCNMPVAPPKTVLLYVYQNWAGTVGTQLRIALVHKQLAVQFYPKAVSDAASASNASKWLVAYSKGWLQYC